MQRVQSSLGAPATSILSLCERTPPRPKILLSKNKLRAAWLNSRDNSRNAGSPGIDNVTALRFAANLDHNLTNLAKQIREGSYGPAPLKPVFIPKPNSEKERMICIPIVSDRLVQRAIVECLVSTRRLPIYNSVSFGFIRGLGTQFAIKAVIELRRQHDWCLKTDIESFFDRIPREYLKERLRSALGPHSLVPIISKVINCEIKYTPFHSGKIERHGIKRGVGVRQGMPLSPILANLVLSRFDKRIERLGIKMVRYADDIVFFFNSKQDAKSGHEQIKSLLNSIDLKIPELQDNSKTQLIGPSDPIDFLGREIVRLGENEIVARVAQRQIRKIVSKLQQQYGLQARMNKGSNFQETMADLKNSVSAYLGVYKDAHNFPSLEGELRCSSRKIITEIFEGLFGREVLLSLPDAGKRFLGLDQLDFGDGFIAVEDI
jgi:RNA-directed DNA polymerase